MVIPNTTGDSSRQFPRNEQQNQTDKNLINFLYFSTTPQVQLSNRTVPHPRGKVVGGSSALNFLIFNRASKTEYDAWAEIGNDGWDWDNLLSSFVSSSNYLAITEDAVFPNATAGTDQERNFVGTEGPIHVGI